MKKIAVKLLSVIVMLHILPSIIIPLWLGGIEFFTGDIEDTFLNIYLFSLLGNVFALFVGGIATGLSILTEKLWNYE